jgi:hypothetical protein
MIQGQLELKKELHFTSIDLLYQFHSPCAAGCCIFEYC